MVAVMKIIDKTDVYHKTLARVAKTIGSLRAMWGTAIDLALRHQHYVLIGSMAFIGWQMNGEYRTTFPNWWMAHSLGRYGLDLPTYGLVMIFCAILLAGVTPKTEYELLLIVPLEFLLTNLVIYSLQTGAASDFSIAIWISYAWTAVTLATTSTATYGLIKKLEMQQLAQNMIDALNKTDEIPHAD